MQSRNGSPPQGSARSDAIKQEATPIDGGDAKVCASSTLKRLSRTTTQESDCRARQRMSTMSARTQERLARRGPERRLAPAPLRPETVDAVREERQPTHLPQDDRYLQRQHAASPHGRKPIRYDDPKPTPSPAYSREHRSQSTAPMPAPSHPHHHLAQAPVYAPYINHSKTLSPSHQHAFHVDPASTSAYTTANAAPIGYPSHRPVSPAYEPPRQLPLPGPARPTDPSRYGYVNPRATMAPYPTVTRAANQNLAWAHLAPLNVPPAYWSPRRGWRTDADAPLLKQDVGVLCNDSRAAYSAGSMASMLQN